jgi:hypothetical protein
MQSLNDDMDELFRRASEEYPLKTDGADWKKMMQKMHPIEEDLPEGDKHSNNYRFLWFLLLLPIGFICGRYMGNKHPQAVATPGKSVTINKAPTINGERETIDADRKTATVTNTAPSKNKTPESDGGAGKAEVLNRGKTDVAKEEKSFGQLNTAGNNRKMNVSEGKLRIQYNSKDQLTESKKNGVNKNVSPAENKTAEEATMVGNRQGTDKTETPTAGEKATNTGQATKTNDSTAAGATKPGSLTLSENKGVSNNKNAYKREIHSNRNLYYSFVAGPDVSMVKFGKTSNVGYTAGLMLGLQVLPKLYIEAGALWDRKSYYSNGEDFDTSRLGLPMHSKVTYVNGVCNMIEIPINVKYDLVSKTSYSWFVSAGVSSYLMQKEYYDISYMRYGPPSYTKDYSYDHASRNLFSILNISAGYQKQVGTNSFISIAPYLKLPIAKVGFGKLPLTSTGIYFSLTKSIH